MGTYTHIPVTHWIDDSYKQYGTIVLVGETSEAQLEQIALYLTSNGGFRPAALADAGLTLNFIGDGYSELWLDRVEVDDIDHGPEDDSEGPFHFSQFAAAMRTADGRGWKTDGEIREANAERAAQIAADELKSEALAVLKAYRAYADEEDDDDSEDKRWTFIEAAIALAEKVSGVKEEEAHLVPTNNEGGNK